MLAVKNNRLTLFLLATSLFIWGVTYFDTLAHMVSVWSNSETYKHCFFIPFICLYLVYEKKNAFFSRPTRPLFWPVLLLMGFQCFFVAASVLKINLLMHLSAYLSFVLIILSTFGYRKVRVIFFPLLYLVFAVPIGEELVPILQKITADLSVGMLSLTPVPVFREGLYIHVPNGTFHVAEACAGIRFLIGTFSIGVLLAYLNYQKIWKRLLFTLLCLIVPVLANGFRAFGIMMIGYYSDMEYATGADHLIYGWVFFAFVTLLIFWMSTFGADREISGTIAPSIDRPHSPDKYRHSVLISLSLCIVLLSPAIVSKVLLESNSGVNAAPPAFLVSRTFTNVSVREHDWTAKTDDSSWEGAIDGVNTRIIYVDEGAGKRELVSSRHRVFDADKWSQRKMERIQVNGIELLNVHLVNAAGTQRELLAWYQLAGFQSYSGLEIKLNQLKRRLSGQPIDGYFFVAAVDGMSEEQIVNMLANFSKLTQ